MAVKRRTLQRLRANQLWHQNTLALMRDVQTTKGRNVELTPAQRAERDAWYQGVAMFNKMNASLAPSTAEPSKVNWDNAPESVKAEREAARVRAETSRIEEETRAIEIRNAELRGEIKGRSERKAA